MFVGIWYTTCVKAWFFCLELDWRGGLEVEVEIDFVFLLDVV